MKKKETTPTEISETKKKDFNFIQLQQQALNLKKADFFNKAVFIILILTIVLSLGIFGYVVQNYRDRFYVIKAKDAERVYSDEKISEVTASNLALDFLEFNPENVLRKLKNVAQQCVPKSQAVTTIMQALNGGYAKSTIDLNINRVFLLKSIKTHSVTAGFAHTIIGQQSNINKEGIDVRDIEIRIETTFYGITEQTPTGYKINNIKITSTKPVQETIK